MRGAIEVEVDTAQDGAVAAARSIPAVAKQLDGKDIKKVIFVPGERCGSINTSVDSKRWMACCRQQRQPRRFRMLFVCRVRHGGAKQRGTLGDVPGVVGFTEALSLRAYN